MKKMKKIISVLLTFILSFFMINNVLADSTGSIEINGTTSGKTYEIYKIFDLTYSGSNVAYTIDSDWSTFFEGEGDNYIVDTNSDELNPITIGNTTKYINITSDNIEEFTKKALIYATTLTGNDAEAVADAETLTFTNLALGYYLVYPKGATDIKDGNGTICSITSTLPNAIVNIKANYPTIEKTVDDQNVEVGQLVMFTITGKVPDTTGYETYTYQIKDTMTTGLELDSTVANFTVKFGENPIEVSPVYTDNGFTLTIDMVNYQEYIGKDITITYKARVTEEAVNSSTTRNSATLTYSNDPKTDTTFTTPEEVVYVFSSEIKVIKVDATDTNIKLAGASFVIKNEEGLYYQAIDSDDNIITNTITTEELISVKWIDDINKATVLVTDESGIITFKGIENGTYYLVETKAPDGYNKLDNPVTVLVGLVKDDGTISDEVVVSHEEIVENNSGIALPSTGGIGTTLFIIVGSLLTLISVVIMITNKRMTDEF